MGSTHREETTFLTKHYYPLAFPLIYAVSPLTDMHRLQSPGVSVPF